MCVRIVYDGSLVPAQAFRKAAAEMRWDKVRSGYARPATLNELEAGPGLGSMTSLQKTEKSWNLPNCFQSHPILSSY
jgi:hypothetical protein